jgi:hypothetical protein
MGQPAKIRLSRDKRNRTLVSTMDGEANGIEAERFYRDEPNRSTERCVSKRITFSRAFTRSRRKCFGSIGKIGKTLVNFPDRVGQVKHTLHVRIFGSWKKG